MWMWMLVFRGVFKGWIGWGGAGSLLAATRRKESEETV